MATRETRVWSNYPLSPGRCLKEEIDYRGISTEKLAEMMDRPIQLVNNIIDAEIPVTDEIAAGIEKALGIKAYLWTNLEASYRATVAHNDLISREGPIHDCYMGEDCPARLTYLEGDDDDDDEADETFTYDDAPSSADVLMDDGESAASD